jgi:hypothetical protein
MNTGPPIRCPHHHGSLSRRQCFGTTAGVAVSRLARPSLTSRTLTSRSHRPALRWPTSTPLADYRPQRLRRTQTASEAPGRAHASTNISCLTRLFKRCMALSTN